MEKIDIKQMKDYIEDTIRYKVFSGELKEGVELTQKQIAESFGVSRMPVREAFLTLEMEGILKRLNNRRIEVSGITNNKIKDNLNILASIEAKILEKIIIEDKYIEQIINDWQKLEIYISKDPIYYEIQLHLIFSKYIEDLNIKNIFTRYIEKYLLYVLKTNKYNIKNIENINNIVNSIKNKQIMKLKENIEIYFNSILK